MYKVIFFTFAALILGSMFHEARADGTNPSPVVDTYKPNYKELKKSAHKTKVATICTCNKKVTKTVRYTVHK